jgi:transposase
MQVERGFTDNWLQPTGEQENLMRQYAGCKRFVWNRALSIEQARYRRGEKKQLGKFAMMRQLTVWRNNPDPHSDFLKDAPVHALQCVLYELYEQIHPPQFKKKSKAKISFTESDSASFKLDEANKRVRLPKLGWVKCRFAQHIEGKPNSVTVKWNGVHWILSVQCKAEIADRIHPSNTIVAGDFGVVRRVTFSDDMQVLNFLILIILRKREPEQQLSLRGVHRRNMNGVIELKFPRYRERDRCWDYAVAKQQGQPEAREDEQQLRSWIFHKSLDAFQRTWTDNFRAWRLPEWSANGQDGPSY